MNKSFNITFAALFTALICILSQICFVTPAIPVTLQILGVALCGFILPLKWSIGCILTYIFMGALGLPIFSSFRGGFQMLIGPTGGFIIGFVLLASCCSLSIKCQKKLYKVMLCASGLALCHIIGVIQYSAIVGVSLGVSFITSSLPFIIKDAVLIFSAYLLAKFIKKRLINFKS